MAKTNKKKIREDFRAAVFKRDKFICQICGTKSTQSKAEELFDAHHITDRHLFEFGGYVLENGITVCDDGENSCHMKCEQFHITNGKSWMPGFHPNDLYNKIKSSFELAIQEDKKNKK